MTEKTAKEKMAENGKSDAEGVSAATAASEESPGKDAEKEKPAAAGIKISMFRVGSDTSFLMPELRFLRFCLIVYHFLLFL